MLRLNGFSVFCILGTAITGRSRSICRFLGAIFLAAGVLGMSACSTPMVRHDVTVFHDWPSGLTPRSFRFADQPADVDELRWKTWRNIIREQLLIAGFSETTNPALEVSFNYQVLAREQRVRRAATVSPYLYFGGRYRHGGIGFSAPLLWSTYPDTYEEVVQVHEHELKLVMRDARSAEKRKLYEGTGLSRAGRPVAGAALPLLVQAVLKDFPGISGVVRQIDIDASELTPTALPAGK